MATEQLYDVVAVRMEDGRERVIATNRNEADAEAVIHMAVLRRGVTEEFFKARKAQEAPSMRLVFHGIEERWACPDCGPGVLADEDGCCTTCGRDCDTVTARVTGYVEREEGDDGE